MRLIVVEEMKSLWKLIGKHRIEFISSVTGPLVEIILQSNHSDIKKTAIDIYRDCLQSCFEHFGNLKEITSKTIIIICQISKSEGLSSHIKDSINT